MKVGKCWVLSKVCGGKKSVGFYLKHVEVGKCLVLAKVCGGGEVSGSS